MKWTYQWTYRKDLRFCLYSLLDKQMDLRF
nr:MAG TPA: hypothetical protein [Caudoviricetes sp.]